MNLLNVSPAIRGDELKSFITDHSPVHRLEEVVQSLKLSEPYRYLKNSRTYLLERYTELEVLNHENTILTSRLASITDNEVRKYDEQKIVKIYQKQHIDSTDSKSKIDGTRSIKVNI